MIRLFYAVLVCFFFSCTAQDTEPALEYRHRPPQKDSKEAPVLIMLHGYGSNENDLFTLAEKMPPAFHVISARAPYPLGNGAYSWFRLAFLENQEFRYDYREVTKSRKMLLQFMRDVCRKFGADSSKVVLLGFSQGAIMSFDIALNAPQEVYGVVAASGGMMPENRSGRLDSAALRRVSFFIGHGLADDVVKFSWSEDARDFLSEAGAQVTFKKYPGGHQIPPKELNDIINWLNGLISEESTR